MEEVEIEERKKGVPVVHSIARPSLKPNQIHPNKAQRKDITTIISPNPIFIPQNRNLNSILVLHCSNPFAPDLETTLLSANHQRNAMKGSNESRTEQREIETKVETRTRSLSEDWSGISLEGQLAGEDGVGSVYETV